MCGKGAWLEGGKATQRRSCGAKVARGCGFQLRSRAASAQQLEIDGHCYFFFNSVFFSSSSVWFLFQFGFIKPSPRSVECFFFLPLEIFSLLCSGSSIVLFLCPSAPGPSAPCSSAPLFHPDLNR